MELIRVNKKNPRPELEQLDKDTLIEMIMAILERKRLEESDTFEEFINP